MPLDLSLSKDEAAERARVLEATNRNTWADELDKSPSETGWTFADFFKVGRPTPADTRVTYDGTHPAGVAIALELGLDDVAGDLLSVHLVRPLATHNRTYPRQSVRDSPADLAVLLSLIHI